MPRWHSGICGGCGRRHEPSTVPTASSSPAILAAVESGESYRDIAPYAGLSYARIYQLVRDAEAGSPGWGVDGTAGTSDALPRHGSLVGGKGISMIWNNGASGLGPLLVVDRCWAFTCSDLSSAAEEMTVSDDPDARDRCDFIASRPVDGEQGRHRSEGLDESAATREP